VKRVLLIEDDGAFRRTLKVILEQEGYAVFEAVDAREGVQMFALLSPDCIITDIHVPCASGNYLLAEIKSFDPQAIVIVISGDLEQLKTSERFGADAIFCKPFKPEELIQTLGRFLEDRLKKEVEAGGKNRQDPPRQVQPLSS
jgi:two-component system, OmpR family, KDP operon response regulator KdpE